MKTSRLLISLFAGLLILSACSTAAGEPTTPADPPDTDPIPPTNPHVPEPSPENTPTTSQTTGYDDLEIITLLPMDAIPAIDNPEFLSASEADSEYAPDELVIGVEFDGDARAYSVSYLSRHEIVNDTVGGVALSVTW
jgi:hypothetical protein